MKKIIVKNNITQQVYQMSQEDFSSEEKLLEKRDKLIEINAWGKPERWLTLEQMEEYEKSITPIDQRLIEYQPAPGELIDTIEYLLPADYTIEIIDLPQSYDWQLQECYRKRKAEYPTIEELAEALMEKFGENRPEKFEQLQAKRLATKSKFPKPSK